MTAKSKERQHVPDVSEPEGRTGQILKISVQILLSYANEAHRQSA